jgi:hypothetical protein
MKFGLAQIQCMSRFEQPPILEPDVYSETQLWAQLGRVAACPLTRPKSAVAKLMISADLMLNCCAVDESKAVIDSE